MTSKKNNEHTDPEKKTQAKKTDNAVKSESTAKTDKMVNKESGSPQPSSSKVTPKPAASTPNNVTSKAATTEKETANIDAKAIEKAQKQGKRGTRLGAVAIIISLLFGGGLAYKMHQDQSQYQAQIAALQQQITQSQQQIKTEFGAVKTQTVQEATTAVDTAKVAIAQQQKSIASLQTALAEVKGRRPNDWLLAEADYLTKLAGRKLFLEHDVESSTQLMESADQRIAALNDPSLMPLRQAMANDIVKLRSIPLIDRDGLVLRLTALQQKIDSLPLANAILPDAPKETKQQVSGDINDWQNNLMTSLKSFSEQFITFRARDGHVIPLLSPKQDFYLRENVKAKIETAIKAVYNEQGEVYRTALNIANQWAGSYFDKDDNNVKEFTQLITSLEKQNIEVTYPVKLQSQKQLSDVINERLRRSVTSITAEEK